MTHLFPYWPQMALFLMIFKDTLEGFQVLYHCDSGVCIATVCPHIVQTQHMAAQSAEARHCKWMGRGRNCSCRSTWLPPSIPSSIHSRLASTSQVCCVARHSLSVSLAMRSRLFIHLGPTVLLDHSVDATAPITARRVEHLQGQLKDCSTKLP